MNLEDLKPAPYNPRKITKAAAAGLKRSIEKFGDLSGIVWNRTSGNIVAGHQRIEQLKALGAVFKPSPPRFVLPDGDEFDVRSVEWDDATEKAANVAANNPHIAGTFVMTDLETMMRDMRAALGPDFADMRFDDLVPKLKFEVDEDDIPEPPKTAVTKLGDVWTLGKHRLVCGDCREVTALEAFSLMVTDPPYGVSYVSKNDFLGVMGKQLSVADPIRGDHMTPADMSALWADAFRVARARAQAGASYYVTGPQGGDLLLLLLLALRESGFPLRHMLIWAKNHIVLGRSDYNYQHEPIIYGWVEGGHHFHGAPGETSLWQIDKPTKSDLHPTMKPVALFSRAISNSSQTGDLVHDPFCGSGTTLIACEQLERRCQAIELDPRYCDVIIERWQNLTGGKATRKNAA